MEILEFKKEIIDLVKSNFKLKEVKTNHLEKFYYPKYIHLMKFNVSQYQVENLGNMAILDGSGLKLMKMITVVFTPSKSKDIPFVIVDFIEMANKITLFVEFYTNHIKDRDSLVNLERNLKRLNIKYMNIENYKENPNWYTPHRNKNSPLKKGTKDDEIVLQELVIEYLEKYLDYCKLSNDITDEKNTKLEGFIDDLIYKGNPSTSVLEKALGREEMIRFFKDTIFYYDGR